MVSEQEKRDKERDFGLEGGTNGKDFVRYAQAPGPVPLSEALASAAAFRNRFPEVARYFDAAKKENVNGQ